MWPCGPLAESHNVGLQPWSFGTYSQLDSPFPSPAFCTQSYAPSPPSFPRQSCSPFTLCKISGNISKCFGCHNKYAKNPDPPEDMCIRHQDWREFTPAGSGTPQSRFGNMYYHFHPQCVWLQCNWFVPSHLYVPPGLVTELGPIHKDQLHYLFHIDL